ncbi:MAG: Multidrug resistance protein MdtA [Planctomycetes bacterium]|nr:Multidrug resistance protein MdtA [Planctomycetota bacterium]
MRHGPIAVCRAAAVTLAALAAGVPAGAQEMPPAAVRTDAVRKETVTERRRVSGNVRAAERTAVAGREAGIVLEAPAREGQHVKAGDLLARIDGERIALELAVIESQRGMVTTTVELRRAERERAQTDLDRMERAVKSDAAAARDLDDARAALKEASSRIAAAEAEFAVLDARAATLRRRADDCTVRAPFDGIVTMRRVSPGAWLDAGGAVADLMSETCEAWIDVPQRDLASLSPGRGEIRLSADATGAAAKSLSSWRVLPDVDPRARTFSVVAPLDASWGFTSGMSLTAWVPTAESAAHLTVSEDALLRGETGPFVYVAMPGAAGAPHTAVRVPVEILFHAGGRAVVRSDRLAEGALAIVEGNERLFPTAPVSPVAAPEGAGKPR